MANENVHRAKKPLAKLESFFGIRRQKTDDEPEVEFVTVKEEKKKIKRVVKARPMSRKHMSEALEAPKVTEQELVITEEVMQRVAPSASEPPKKAVTVDTFMCVECGAQVPNSAERCPICNALYVKDVLDKDLEELENAEGSISDEPEEVLEKTGEIPCIHFNPESGIISYLEKDTREPDFVMECSYCGTVVEFDTDKCPICGKKFDVTDSGIVSIFSDMEFDNDCTGEIDCPLCGEKIVPRNGKCPACKESVHLDDPRDPSSKVEPLIHNDNVVFLHLDVETGEVNYLQRLAHKFGFEQLTVQLEGIGRSGFEHENDWKSLSRI